MDMTRASPCRALFSINAWYSLSSMPRNQNGRLGLDSPSRRRPSRSPAAAKLVGEVLSALLRTSDTRFEDAASSGLGSRRGKPRLRKPSGELFVERGMGGSTTVGLVRPSEVRLAPRSTGLIKVTVREPQRSPC